MADEHVRDYGRKRDRELLDDLLAELLDVEDLLDEVADDITVDCDDIAERLRGNPPDGWRDDAEAEVDDRRDETAKKRRLRELLAERIAEST